MLYLANTWMLKIIIMWNRLYYPQLYFLRLYSKIQNNNYRLEMERCVIFLANFIKHNVNKETVTETAYLIVPMQESYISFHSNNIHSYHTLNGFGLALLCICELQELTFLQLKFFIQGMNLCL